MSRLYEDIERDGAWDAAQDDDAYDLARDAGIFGKLWPAFCNLCAKHPPLYRDYREGAICAPCRTRIDREDRDPSLELET